MGFEAGKNPRPNPKFVVLLLRRFWGSNWGIEAGWKLYENLLGGKDYFLLAGIMELSEPIGFNGLEPYFLYELS